MMENKLFRPEVYEHKRRRLLGDMLLTQPISIYLVSSCFFAFFVLIACVFFFAKLNTKIDLEGILKKNLSEQSHVDSRDEYEAWVTIPTKLLSAVKAKQSLVFSICHDKTELGKFKGNILEPLQLIPNSSIAKNSVMIKVRVEKYMLNTNIPFEVDMDNLPIKTSIALNSNSLYQWIFKN